MAGRSPGTGWSARRGQPVERGGGGGDGDEAHAVLEDGVAEAQVAAPPAPRLGSAPTHSTVPPGAQSSSMVARGRPSTTSAGRPSPIWASTLSVPMHALGQLGPGVGVLVGEAGAAEHGDGGGRGVAQRPWPRPGGRRPTRSRPARRSRRPAPAGRRSRSSDSMASKPKRPLSHSQPQLTGSTSTPLWRSDLGCGSCRPRSGSPPRSPGRWTRPASRSHGRALNRYGSAVRAPTGQICTVLPRSTTRRGGPGRC